MEVFLYLIAGICDGVPRAPIKVGLSRTPVLRLRTLQTNNPCPMAIVRTQLFPDWDDARVVEKRFHAQHRDRRIRGEWFDIEPSEAAQSLFEGA